MGTKRKTETADPPAGDEPNEPTPTGEETPAEPEPTPAEDEPGAEPDTDNEDDAPQGMKHCPLCEGAGVVPDVVMQDEAREACDKCGGLGMVATGSLMAEFAMSSCVHCNGGGWRWKDGAQQPPTPIDIDPALPAPVGDLGYTPVEAVGP